jgi:hypothetical protein
MTELARLGLKRLVFYYTRAEVYYIFTTLSEKTLVNIVVAGGGIGQMSPLPVV